MDGLRGGPLKPTYPYGMRGPQVGWGPKSLKDWLRLKKIVLFVDGGIWLCFTGSKNQLDILIFSAGSDCNLDELDYISQNQVF